MFIAIDGVGETFSRRRRGWCCVPFVVVTTLGGVVCIVPNLGKYRTKFREVWYRTLGKNGTEPSDVWYQTFQNIVCNPRLLLCCILRSGLQSPMTRPINQQNLSSPRISTQTKSANSEITPCNRNITVLGKVAGRMARRLAYSFHPLCKRQLTLIPRTRTNPHDSGLKAGDTCGPLVPPPLSPSEPHLYPHPAPK